MYVCMHFCMSACAAMYIVCIPPPVQLNLAMDPRLSGWGKDSLRVSVVVKKLFHCFLLYSTPGWIEGMKATYGTEHE